MATRIIKVEEFQEPDRYHVQRSLIEIRCSDGLKTFAKWETLKEFLTLEEARSYRDIYKKYSNIKAKRKETIVEED